jgi:hypothetical protein
MGREPKVSLQEKSRSTHPILAFDPACSFVWLQAPAPPSGGSAFLAPSRSLRTGSRPCGCCAAEVTQSPLSYPMLALDPAHSSA